MQDKLLKLLENSYSPYSGFRVASVAVMKDGKEFVGVNVENAAYMSICAERNAIMNAVSHGYKRYDFKELHVMCDSEKVSMPCFICRMTISEMLEPQVQVISYSKKGKIESHTVQELCPYPFSDDDLSN